MRSTRKNLGVIVLLVLRLEVILCQPQPTPAPPPVVNAGPPTYCENMDLSTFCVIGNQFRQVVYDEQNKKMKYYHQFEKIVRTFFPPPIDIVAGTGEVEPWPWIQDHQDDFEYMKHKRRYFMVSDESEVKVILAGTSPVITTTVGEVQGYRFNLYSVNDVCALDKLYSPVYKLFTDPADPQVRLKTPSQIGTVSGQIEDDMRLYYSDPGRVTAFKPDPPVPGAPIVYPAAPTIGAKNFPAWWHAAEGWEQWLVNPFEVKITEIKVAGRRLHNHLHFEVGYENGTFPPTGTRTQSPPNIPGAPPAAPKLFKKISYAFILVHDHMGWPIGDFDTGVPCGTCGGKCPQPTPASQAECHQGVADDTIPCMFLSKGAVTHPGQMMIHFPPPSQKRKVHATWRFAQSSHYELSFSREIHVKTLLVLEEAENEPMVLVRDKRFKYNYNMPTGSSGTHKLYECGASEFTRDFASEAPQACYHSYKPKYGVFGWNAKYPILYPTAKTLGGWDHFPRHFIQEDQVDCHMPLDPAYYTTEQYPAYGKDANSLRTTGSRGWDPMGPVGAAGQSKPGPFRLFGAKGEIYQGLTKELPNYYTGLVDEEALKLVDGMGLNHPRIEKYIDKKRVVNLPAVKKVPLDLSKLKKIEDIQEQERCRCARFGTVPPPPGEQVPDIGHLEGRRDHAIQMTVAWVALVPFAFFVARYYKETYQKVFFLQEFWWFTTHVLTLLLALVFIVGAMYAIEIKRENPFNWNDKNQVLHGALGAVSITMFTIQFCLGAFRMKNPRRRRLQIFFHWLFGLLNYLLAIGSMVVASFIRSGAMSCPTLILVFVWLGIQLTLYIIMEIHMRMMDKQMDLKPKRTYLPPPVMRVFHKNAPGAKFRVIMLCIFGFFSMLFYALMHFTIELPPAFRSCFNIDTVLENIQTQYIKSQ